MQHRTFEGLFFYVTFSLIIIFICDLIIIQVNHTYFIFLRFSLSCLRGLLIMSRLKIPQRFGFARLMHLRKFISSEIFSCNSGNYHEPGILRRLPIYKANNPVPVLIDTSTKLYFFYQRYSEGEHEQQACNIYIL